MARRRQHPQDLGELYSCDDIPSCSPTSVGILVAWTHNGEQAVLAYPDGVTQTPYEFQVPPRHPSLRGSLLILIAGQRDTSTRRAPFPLAEFCTLAMQQTGLFCELLVA